jgi:hypothetical protein
MVSYIHTKRNENNRRARNKMATTKKQKINFYQLYATQNLILAMDDHSLFCKVISETVEGVSYRVEMDESTMTATSCSCPARGACKHLEIANSLSYKVAPVEAPVVEETTITEVERKQWYVVNHQHQVWSQDGVWMCAEGAEWVALVMAHLGIEQPVEVPTIAMDLPAELRGYRKTAVSTDISNKGEFGSKPFNLLKVG